MYRSPIGFLIKLFFALLAIIAVPQFAAAQDMPPILAPLAAPIGVAPNPESTSPSAEAIIPPAVVKPPAAPTMSRVAAVDHPKTMGYPGKSAAAKNKFVALMKRLASAHHNAVHHLANGAPEPNFPRGTIVPPPDYYASGPYQHLVYGGPPMGVYGGWGGYRGRYPYYP
jgi:hypothetical protein